MSLIFFKTNIFISFTYFFCHTIIIQTKLIINGTEIQCYLLLSV